MAGAAVTLPEPIASMKTEPDNVMYSIHEHRL